MNIIRSVIEDLKAWRRGEVRVAPRGTSGRIYAKKGGEEPSAGTHKVKAEPIVTLEMKVMRANGDVEVIKVPGVMRHG